MTDIQAALGVSQLNRLEEFITKRHSIAQRYNDNLADLPLLTPFQHPDSFSSYHLYPVRLDLSGAQYDQKAVYQALQSSGIGVNVHYIPVYRHPYYEAMGFEVGYCPESELYYKECLSLPIYPNLSEECQDRVIECLRDTLKK
jgi:dTDP-4-amino-4,6-dideoxygalactose transaminase